MNTGLRWFGARADINRSIKERRIPDRSDKLRAVPRLNDSRETFWGGLKDKRSRRCSTNDHNGHYKDAELSEGMFSAYRPQKW